MCVTRSGLSVAGITGADGQRPSGHVRNLIETLRHVNLSIFVSNYAAGIPPSIGKPSPIGGGGLAGHGEGGDLCGVFDGEHGGKACQTVFGRHCGRGASRNDIEEMVKLHGQGIRGL